MTWEASEGVAITYRRGKRKGMVASSPKNSTRDSREKERQININSLIEHSFLVLAFYFLTFNSQFSNNTVHSYF